MVLGSKPVRRLVHKIYGILSLPHSLISSLPSLVRTLTFLSLSLSLSLFCSVLGPTHMGGRHATCAYWADYTQAHVVQWWPCTSIPMMSSLNRRSHMTEPFSATAYLGIRLSFRWHQGAETHVGYHATSPQLF